MSKKVDKFIAALFKAKGDELLFTSTRPVRIRVGQDEKVVLDQEVRTDQIDNLIKPCLTAEEGTRYAGNGEGTYYYESSAGRVRIHTRRKNAMVMVVISPDVAAAVAVAAAAEVVEAAPSADAGMLPGFDSGRHAERARRSETPAVVTRPPTRAASRAKQSQAAQAPEPRPRQPTQPPPTQADDGARDGGEGGHRGGKGGGHDGGGHGGGKGSGHDGGGKGGGHDGGKGSGHGGGGHGGGGHGGGGHGGGGRAIADEVDDVPRPAPGMAMIDKILTQLAKAGASDLHLTAGQRPKMRKDGDIQDVPGGWDIASSDLIQKWMFEVAPKRIRQEYLNCNDADYAHEVPGIARFRMNIFRDRAGTGAVIRTIPSKVLTADELNLPPVIRSLCSLPKGLVCVTGPTGSGKSTTLAAMVDLINKTRHDHIITIEDPVEFVHQSQKCLVNQREVHSHTESFSRALRAALREDPDIVLVGEMRDLETVHIAIETAETGHLVFGTLHTNTAPSTVDRIIDQFPADRQSQIRVMLSESLRGVISQTLCKKVGGGRVACLEILVVNNAVANLIREGKTFQIPSMMQTGKKDGMMTQIDWMMDLVKTGKVSPLEAYTKAADQGMMKGALERAGHKIEVK